MLALLILAVLVVLHVAVGVGELGLLVMCVLRRDWYTYMFTVGAKR